MGITATFTYPFFQGAQRSAVVPSTFPVAIDGHPFAIDTRQYFFQTLDKQRAQFSQGDEPDEGTFNPESFWPRTQSDWYFGAGQSDFDEEVSFRLQSIDDEGSIRKRFNTSRGVNPWQHGRLTLLNDTREIFDTTETNLKMLTVGGYLYVTVGDTLRFTDDPTGASPTFSTATTSTNEDIVDITTNGTTIFVATASNVESIAVGATGTMSVFSTQDADLILYAGGGDTGSARLVIAHDNVLSELDSSGTATAIYTHWDTSLDWVALASTPIAIFAAASVGGKVRFYSIIPDDAGAALGIPIYAGELPDGESLYAMSSYGNYLLLGTSKSLRVAEIGTGQSFRNGALRIGPSLETCQCPGTPTPTAVRCFEPQGQFVWFGWSDFDDTYSGLGRVDLSRSTRRDSIIPAYASDLMAEEQGTVTGVATFGDYRYFAISGKGVYAEYANKVVSGYLTSGSIRHGTWEKKIFTGVTLGHAPLEGSVSVELIREDGTTTTPASSSIAESTISELFEVAYTGRRTNLKLTLNRSGSDATTGPSLKFWSLNAIPAPPRVDEILVPLIFAPKVKDLNGQERTMDVLAELNFLQSLVATGRFVPYQEGRRTIQVRVDKVAMGQGNATDMADMRLANRGWFQGIVSVRLLTRERSL